MKVRVDNQELADEISRALGTDQNIFEAVENYCDWTDDDGVLYAYHIIIFEGDRRTIGYWAHKHEVVVLTPSEELAALGYPNYSDDFAEEVLLYMMENDLPAHAAIKIILYKDIANNSTDRRES